LPRFLSWSPDGKQLALAGGAPSEALGAIEIFDLDKGKTRLLVTFKDKLVSDVRWLPEGLLVIYQQTGPNFNRQQIGVIPTSSTKILPKLAIRTITRR
jgi:WD40 repeat protein